MHKKILACIFVTLAATLLFAGCAKNTVPLTFQAEDENTLPVANAPTVTLVTLKDLRAKPPVGQRSDGTDFMPSSDVGEWISHALTLELRSNGFVVNQAESEAQAKASGAKYIVTGSIDEVWLTEQSTTEYNARMRGSLALNSGKKAPDRRTFNSSLTRRVVPLSDVPQKLLSEAMRDLVSPMALFVREAVPR